MAFRPRTARDSGRALQESLEGPRRSTPRSQLSTRHKRLRRKLQDEPEDTENPTLECPRCLRAVQADMLVELPTARIRGRFGGASHVCDRCRERAFLKREVTREEFVREIGAPTKVIERMRRKDTARPVRLQRRDP